MQSLVSCSNILRAFSRKPGRWTPQGIWFLEDFQRYIDQRLKYVRPVFLSNLFCKLLESLELDRSYFSFCADIADFAECFRATASIFLVVFGFLVRTCAHIL